MFQKIISGLTVVLLCSPVLAAPSSRGKVGPGGHEIKPEKKDFTRECEDEVSSKADAATSKKVAELEKNKQHYSREKIFAETKRELFDACMKKHK